MAKFAQVGYGSRGQGAGKSGTGYTYIVNDNVRTGDVIQVVATSSKGRKFGTTGKTMQTTQNLSNEKTLKQQIINQEAKTQLKAKGYIRVDENGKIIDIDSVKKGDTGLTTAYSGKELGVTGFRGSEDYEKSSRGGQIAKYKQQHPNAEITENAQKSLDAYNQNIGNSQRSQKQETFDEYSKKYMK